MTDETDRVVRALTDVIAVEQQAPDMFRVITVSDEHIVDTRHERCTCFDMQYHLQGDGRCKHLWRALIETNQLPMDTISGVEDL
jgi:hypothetical protein